MKKEENENYVEEKQKDDMRGSWSDVIWTLDACLKLWRSNKIFYWDLIQRIQDSWDLDRKQETMISMFNGHRWGTNLMLYDMVQSIDFCDDIEDLYDKEVLEYVLQELKEEYGSEKLQYAIAEANHRINVADDFVKDGFPLPIGAVIFSQNHKRLSLKRKMHFSELPEDFQNSFMNTRIPITILVGQTEYAAASVDVVNSAKPWSPAENRKLKIKSNISRAVAKIQKKWYHRLGGRDSKIVSTKVLKDGKLMHISSTFFYWLTEGFAPSTLTDKMLLEFHNSCLIGQSKYKDEQYRILHKAADDMGEALIHPDKPLVPLRKDPERPQSKVDNRDLFGYLMFRKILEDKEFHLYLCEVKDNIEVAKIYTEIDYELFQEHVPKKTVEDFKNEGFVDPMSEWKKYFNDVSYDYWSTQPNSKAPSLKRYNAMLKKAKERLPAMLKAGILVIKNPVYYTDSQKNKIAGVQGQIDPLSEERLIMATAQCHHKLRIAHGGLTTLENGAMLNKDIHTIITCNTEVNDMSWDELVENKDRIKEILKASRKQQLPLFNDEMGVPAPASVM